MAAHRTHTDTKSVHRYSGSTKTGANAHDLVRLGHAFPFFLAHPVTHVFVDPGDE